MNDYFSRLSDFNQLSGKLLEATSLVSFNVWLDKLARIDRRSTVLYLRAHKDEIPEDRLKLAARICRTDI